MVSDCQEIPYHLLRYAAMRSERLLIASLISAAVALASAACSKSDSSPSTSSSCQVTLGSVPTSVAGGATSGSIPVTAASTCAWTAASSASFLTISSGASGTGNGSVAYAIAANTGAARSASIVVNGVGVNFTQAAQQVLAPAGCAVTLSATTGKVNSGGGTININVTGASNCGYTATSNAAFLTVPSGTVTGNGTIVITAAQNT